MENKRQDMNRLVFIMSNILTFLGIVLLSTALTIRALLTGGPSHFLFEAFVKTGIWGPEAYTPNLSGVYVISVLCIVVGLVLSVVFYKKGSK
ncbi:MAG: hypothetical protein PWP22_1383 [Thermoanaerobacter sp.]|uniref:hypothetical protein n=1 Tax=Methermicoccus shengliensis TaxID=660064 RepID=UPI00076CF9B0|nr:hypothetical protein [Methermicoccus shengliensis]KUK30276.1 MAG: hypothetical protein XD62_0623 [Methanosarcinales archeaon 56_1174]MDI3501612.1 hypothetical protein [Thermoanaerobacter sp.]